MKIKKKSELFVFNTNGSFESKNVILHPILKVRHRRFA
jgi:hypothetical protein